MSALVIAGDLREKIDISVRVRGGGYMGQASAIARNREYDSGVPGVGSEESLLA